MFLVVRAEGTWMGQEQRKWVRVWQDMSMGRRMGKIIMDFKCYARNLGNWSRWKDLRRGMTEAVLNLRRIPCVVGGG